MGYTASTRKYTEETGNDHEGSDSDLIELTYRHMNGEAENNHSKPQ
jgi:hypothetical protein